MRVEDRLRQAAIVGEAKEQDRPSPDPLWPVDIGGQHCAIAQREPVGFQIADRVNADTLHDLDPNAPSGASTCVIRMENHPSGGATLGATAHVRQLPQLSSAHGSGSQIARWLRSCGLAMTGLRTPSPRIVQPITLRDGV